MSEKGLRSVGSAGHRHVPANSSHRVRRALLAALILFTSTPAYPEGKAGSAAQIVKRTDLRKRPADDSPSLGRIPKGTIVTLTGERQNGFVAVEVELEEGSIEGWLPKDTLNKAARNELPPVEGDEAAEKLPVRRRSDVEPDEEDEEVLIRPRSRMRVPKDEGLLLRRDPLFIYGLQVTGGLSMQVPDYTTEEYMGPAFGAGAHVCLGQHIARVEIDALLREVLSRMHDIELAQPPEWLASNFISGPKRMPVRFRPDTRRG